MKCLSPVASSSFCSAVRPNRPVITLSLTTASLGWRTTTITGRLKHLHKWSWDICILVTSLELLPLDGLVEFFFFFLIQSSDHLFALISSSSVVLLFYYCISTLFSVFDTPVICVSPLKKLARFGWTEWFNCVLFFTTTWVIFNHSKEQHIRI